jgi:teichuronic acid biosynthesis glycosyltransferase TuaG
MISIITPTYNSSKFISESISSVLAQTYTNWELFIIDDCSKDNTVEIIKSFSNSDSRIKLIELNKNVGAAEARNEGLKLVKTPYIAFLDSDDIWTPDKLEKQLNFMLEKDIAFSFTSYYRILESRKLVNIIVAPLKLEYKSYLKNTIIGSLTVMIDITKTGPFKMQNIRSSHDMELWCRLLKKGVIAYGIPIPLAKYRLVNTSNTANKLKAAKDVWFVYRKFEKIPLIYSVYYFLNYSFNVLKKNHSNLINS